MSDLPSPPPQPPPPSGPVPAASLPREAQTADTPVRTLNSRPPPPPRPAHTGHPPRDPPRMFGERHSFGSQRCASPGSNHRARYRDEGARDKRTPQGGWPSSYGRPPASSRDRDWDLDRNRDRQRDSICSEDRSRSLKRSRSQFEENSRGDWDRGNHSSVLSSQPPQKQRRYDPPRVAPVHSIVPDFNVVARNPHLLQVLARGSQYQSHADIPFSRYLAENAPRLKYRRRKGEVKSTIHWGQRKLLLSEYGKEGHTVVYAGAAPGTHTPYLVSMFPKLYFVLVDPAPFSEGLKRIEGERVVLRQELFTDEIAAEFTGQQVLFVCDIRSTDWQIDDEEEVESRVSGDMEAQMRWHNIMKPLKSMLKFRLSWKAGTTEYLAGDIELPVWGPVTTTESRLIPSEGTTQWDNTKYEEQMFYFNTIQRVGRYKHDCIVDPAVTEGLDYCFDCKAEVEILSEYLVKERGLEPGPQVLEQVAKMTREMSRECGGGRTLLTGNLDPGKRKANIQKRQWIRGMPAYDAAIAPEPEPMYSDKSKAMMSMMGYKEGESLGLSTQGPVEPIDPQTQLNRRGLGFTPKGVFVAPPTPSRIPDTDGGPNVPETGPDVPEATSPVETAPTGSQDSQAPKEIG